MSLFACLSCACRVTSMLKGNSRGTTYGIIFSVFVHLFIYLLVYILIHTHTHPCMLCAPLDIKRQSSHASSLFLTCGSWRIQLRSSGLETACTHWTILQAALFKCLAHLIPFSSQNSNFSGILTSSYTKMQEAQKGFWKATEDNVLKMAGWNTKLRPFVSKAHMVSKRAISIL